MLCQGKPATQWCFRYKVCAKRVLGICFREAMHEDVYDLADPAVNAQFVNMGAIITFDLNWRIGRDK